LTAALSDVNLADLRLKVEQDTDAWTLENNALIQLVAAAEAAEDVVRRAEDAKDAAVLAC
jgi:hypothetical protein